MTDSIMISTDESSSNNKIKENLSSKVLISTLPPPPRSSRLFTPYRSLGYVCGKIPFHLKLLGQERFITVAIGKAWQLDRLRIVQISPPSVYPILSLVSSRFLTFTTAHKNITVYMRTTPLISLYGHSHPIYYLFLLGSQYLLSVDEGQIMKVWSIRRMGIRKAKEEVKEDLDDEEEEKDDDKEKQDEDVTFDQSKLDLTSHPSCIATISLPLTSSLTRLNHIIHPPTYLNKVLLVFNNGALMLYNVNSQSVIHNFDTSQWCNNSSITAITNSPAVDIICLGTHSGSIAILNIRNNQLIATYQQNTPVTALSFRLDGFPYLASGTTLGHVHIWHLDSHSHHSTLRHVHRGPILSLSFLPNEPLLVTSSTDNSIHIHAFDKDTHTSHILKSRTGHSTPPTLVRWYESESEHRESSTNMTLLTSSTDGSLRMFSLRKDEASAELSQGQRVKKKRKHLKNGFYNEGESESMFDEGRLNSIIDFSFSSNRKENQYSNIVTAHQSDTAGHLWSYSSLSLSSLTLTHATATISPATSVCMSSTGAYAIVGHADGTIHSYIVQSANYHGSYGHTNNSKKRVRYIRKGVIWNLEDILLPEKITPYRSGVTNENEKKENLQTEELIVEEGHTHTVTGLAIDSLQQLMISTSLDGTIRIWDFSKRHLITSMDVGIGISKLCYHKENDLFAVATDDYRILVYDASIAAQVNGERTTRFPLVRTFSSHTQPITDMCFSPSGHLLLSSSISCTIHIHDLPSSIMIDSLQFNTPVLSLSFAHGFLLTCHGGNVGIMMWAWRGWMGTALDENEKAVEMEEVEEEEIDDTSTKMIESTDAKVSLLKDAKHHLEEDSIRFGLITYSALPRSHWHTLSHLDAIRHRGQTKALTKPSNAPFFLSSLNLSGGPDKNKKTPAEEEAEKEEKRKEEELNARKEELEEKQQRFKSSRFIQSKGVIPKSYVLRMLEEGKQKLNSLSVKERNDPQLVYQTYRDVLAYFKSLTPSSLDIEVRSIGLDPLTESLDLALYLHFFNSLLLTRTNFEFVQSLLSVFLSAHSSTLLQYPDCMKLVKKVLQVQQKGWGQLEEGFQKNLAVIAHLSKIN